jgi:hypothetical protein
MKLQFPKRKRGQVSVMKKIQSHVSNFIYHWRNGKNPVQAWHLAKKTF